MHIYINNIFSPCLIYIFTYKTMSEKQILIVSDYLGCKWAAQILLDWQIKVIFDRPTPNTVLIITDQTKSDSLKHYQINKLIIKDISISAPHVWALSSILRTFGQQKEHFIPKFVIELVVAIGITIFVLSKVYEKAKESNKVHGMSVITLVKYFGAFFISAKENGLLDKQRGKNVLQGGSPFYTVYQCKAGFLAVGNLQPKFYQEMIQGLDLPEETKEFCMGGQFNFDQADKLRQILRDRFKEKTAREWEQHFMKYDTCITQIKAPFQSKIIEPKLIDLRAKL